MKRLKHMVRMKRLWAAGLAFLLLAGCSSAQPKQPDEPKQPDGPKQPVSSATVEDTAVVFTDSLGREATLEKSLTRIAPSGSVAQMIVYTLAPELLVGWSSNPDERAKPYIPATYWELPEFGQFYGKNVTLNIEALVAAAPQVIIDMGDIKPNMAGDLDGISEQLGLPVIFLEATLETMPQAYRTLGKLLNKEEKAEQLAQYCETTLSMAQGMKQDVPQDQRVSAYYGTGTDGLACNALGSIHAAVLDLVGVNNAAVVENVSQKGGGNLINMEQLLLFDPDILLLSASGIYEEALTDPTWSQLKAIQSGRVYEIPNMPYDFLSSPPSINRMIGIHWLAWVVYPTYYPSDFVQELKTFYQLFYDYTLTDTEVTDLLLNAGGQTAT